MLQTAAQRAASMGNMKKAKAAPKEKIYRQSTVNSALSTEPFRVTRLILGDGKKRQGLQSLVTL